ncbi:MAG TPA: hypothetical protein DCO71_07170, partial [Gammaproteobacteria bacterium]|nr:hypothetical protein [Gammaproteobacteria bacterium]
MKKLLLALIFVMTPLSGMAAGPVAGGDRPLLMAGKHSLYQRVLSVPGARMASEPGGQARTAVVPFTAYYVYARREQGGKEWLELGIDRHGSRAGWLPGADCIEWNHGLTAAFRDPAGHDRVLLFRDSASLRQLAGQSDLTAYERLYSEAVQGQLSADSPVVAMQPSGHIDIREDFYLVPIHRHEDVYLGSEKARLLQVSSVPLASKTGSAGAQAYTAGVVFVIDSTLSMQPYIERTQEAVTTIFASLNKA